MTDSEKRAALVAHLARAIGLLGLALLSYGAHLAWHPAGWIVPGILLIAVAVGALRNA